MKISLERDALLGQLQAVSRVASTRSAIQALSGVQLAATNDACELRATDMDVGLRVPLEAEVAREGVVVLPARLLLDVVRSLPAPQVSLELRCSRAGRGARVRATPPSTSGRSAPRTSLHSPSPRRKARCRLPAETFVATALKVAGSASRDETRPVLTGILASGTGQELRMVATDSYRLERQGDGARCCAVVVVRGQRASSRPTGAGPRCRAHRRRADQHQRAPEPGAVRGRRRDPVFAPDRRPVPQLPPAAARERSSTS